MSRPWKHPNSGVYWFRRVVPADLRALVGKREEKQSLKSKGPAVAKQRHAQALSEVEARWANLRRGSRSISEAETHAIAAVWHDRWIEQHRDNPSEQSWPTSLAEAMWKQGVISPNAYMTDEVRSHLQEVQAKIQNAENWPRQGNREPRGKRLHRGRHGAFERSQSYWLCCATGEPDPCRIRQGNYGFQSISTQVRSTSAGS